jgi:hypothetical protein
MGKKRVKQFYLDQSLTPIDEEINTFEHRSVRVSLSQVWSMATWSFYGYMELHLNRPEREP